MLSNNALLSAWSYALLIILYIFLSFKLIKLNLVFLSRDFAKPIVILAMLLTVFWGVFLFLDSIFKNDIYRHFGAIFDFLRYGVWCYFLIEIVCVHSKKNRNIKISLLAIIFMYVLISVTLPLLSGNGFGKSKVISDFEYYGRLGRLAFSIFSLFLVEQLYFGVNTDDRWRIKPLIIGLAGIFIFDLYVFSDVVLFGSIDSDASAVRGLIHALIAPLLFVSMTSKKRNNLRLRFTQKSVFNSFSLFLSAIYLILISGVGYYVKYFGGDWGRTLQVTVIYISLLIFSIILFTTSIRSKFKVYIDKNFFHYLYDYREEWLNFTNILVCNNSDVDVWSKTIKAFSNILKSPGGSLWVQKSSSGAFNQVAYLNQKHTHKSEDSQSSFCQFMARTGWVINVDQYRNSPEIYGGMALPDWIHEFPETWLVVPLFVGEEMIGFCTLDKARNPVEVNWEVNDLLKTAGRQAAGFIAQMQATEALLESRKFAAFNRMSAFVVHDLKNIFAQLSLMMKNSQRLLSNPEFQKDMLLTVDNSLVRMQQLMHQLREGAPMPKPSSGVNLEVVLERLEKSVFRSGRKIDLNLKSPVLSQGQEDRVERILGHLVQNALDATVSGGHVQLSLDKVFNQAEITLCDTGHGMTPEFVSQCLFKPFQTTKQHGMGIGAYESFQYIQELFGSIHVESKQGIGTTITIMLPIFESVASGFNDGLEQT